MSDQPKPHPLFGKPVLYVPSAQAHANDWANREPCFYWHYDGGARDGEEVELTLLQQAPPHVPAHAIRELRQGDHSGAPVRAHLGQRTDPATGKELTIRLGKPRSHWPAIVTGVHEDGTVDLEIEHPSTGSRGYHNIAVIDRPTDANADMPLHSCYLAE